MGNHCYYWEVFLIGISVTLLIILFLSIYGDPIHKWLERSIKEAFLFKKWKKRR